MSRKERERLVVLERVMAKALSRREGAAVLGFSLRQMHRVFARWRKEGDEGLLHQSRGRPSSRRLEEGDRLKALALYRSRYLGFGPTLFAEKLAECDGIWISHDTALRWLRAEGLWERSRRGRRSRRRRARKERFGQMVQMDGSPHAWFGDRGPACVLMTVIDDATGRRRGWFYPSETMWAAMDAFGRWCRDFGLPQSLYVDRHGIYRADRDATVEEQLSGQVPLTQFGRAMEELSVRLIKANSPQAKGRVERSNGVCQDRLVKELQLQGISSIASANAWLDQSGYFSKLDEKFAVAASVSGDAHRPLVCDLAEVLCIKEERTVGADGCVQWCGRVLQMLDAGALRKVQVQERSDGSLAVLGQGRQLKWQEIAPSRLRQLRAERAKAQRKPVMNNKRVKPTAAQQIRLGPIGGKSARPSQAPAAKVSAGLVAESYAPPRCVKVPPHEYMGPLPPGSSTLTHRVCAIQGQPRGQRKQTARTSPGLRGAPRLALASG